MSPQNQQRCFLASPNPCYPLGDPKGVKPPALSGGSCPRAPSPALCLVLPDHRSDGAWAAPGERDAESARGASSPRHSWTLSAPVPVLRDSHGCSENRAPRRGFPSRKHNTRPGRSREGDAAQAPRCSEASASKARPFPAEFLPGNWHVALSARPGGINSSWGLRGAPRWAGRRERTRGSRGTAGTGLCRKQGPGKIPSVPAPASLALADCCKAL